MTAATPVHDITAVILAGGKARRMNGEDKGLITLRGRAMIDYIIAALRPQAGTVIINANRNRQQYGSFGLPVIADILDDYLGPLVGMATGMRNSETPYIVTTPCDSPFIPDTLVETLYHALADKQAEISVAHDGVRMQPVFALLRRHLLDSMIAYLRSGESKIDTWYATHRTALADFSDDTSMFLNVNTPEDRQQLESSVLKARES